MKTFTVAGFTFSKTDIASDGSSWIRQNGIPRLCHRGWALLMGRAPLPKKFSIQFSKHERPGATKLFVCRSFDKVRVAASPHPVSFGTHVLRRDIGCHLKLRRSYDYKPIWVNVVETKS